MGWWTQITIIAEHVADARAMAQYIYEQDAKTWKDSGYTRVCYQNGEAGQRLFFTYERRNCIPDWVIAELSKSHPDAYFTAFSDMAAWFASPGGLLRYQAGKLLDGYLVDERRRDLMRPSDLQDRRNGLFHPDFLYHWFGQGKPEEQICCQVPAEGMTIDNAFEGMFEFDKDQLEILDTFIAEWNNGGFRSMWTDITFA